MFRSFMKKAVQRLCLIVLGLVLAGLIGEAILHIPGLPIKMHNEWMFLMVEHDPTLGWRMKPNIEGELDMFEVQDIPIRTNGTGFWDDEFVGRGEEELRIVLLGDSFTWGTGVFEDERFGNLLEELEPGWECMNFGLPAYGTDQALLVWRHVASGFAPDLVVLTMHRSDYVDNMREILWGRPKPYFMMSESDALELQNSPVVDFNFWDTGIFHRAAPLYEASFRQPETRRSRVAHWLVTRSRLVRTSWNAIRAIRAGAAGPPPPPPTEVAPSQETEIQLLTALVRQLQAEVESAGGRLLVQMAGEMDARFQAQMRIFDDEGIAYLDITTEPLLEETGIEPDELYFESHAHWTPGGQQGVAALLHGRIAEMVEQGSPEAD